MTSQTDGMLVKWQHLIFAGHFPPKSPIIRGLCVCVSPIISGSFVENLPIEQSKVATPITQSKAATLPPYTYVYICLYICIYMYIYMYIQSTWQHLFLQSEQQRGHFTPDETPQSQTKCQVVALCQPNIR